MLKNVRFCDENLNRLFRLPNAAQTNIETKRAVEIMAEVDKERHAYRGRDNNYLDE